MNGTVELRGDRPLVLAASGLFSGVTYDSPSAPAPIDARNPDRRRVVVAVQVMPDGGVHVSAAHSHDTKPRSYTLATTSEWLWWLDTLVCDCHAEWHPHSTHIHAACVSVAHRDTPWSVLITGESGSGKSSIAHAAMRAGASVWADEHTCLDDRGLWGLPRSIQFDSVDAESAVARHPGWDLQTYSFHHAGRRVVRPLVPIPAPNRFASTANVLTIFPSPSDLTAITAMPGSEALPRLLEQVIGGPKGSLTPVLQHIYRLSWKRDDEAWEAIMETIAALSVAP